VSNQTAFGLSESTTIYKTAAYLNGGTIMTNPTSHQITNAGSAGYYGIGANAVQLLDAPYELKTLADSDCFCRRMAIRDLTV